MFMNIDTSDLTLMQLSDSFFPSGLYTMSNGLETLFDEKRVCSESDVYEFLEMSISAMNITNDFHRELIGGAKMGRQLIFRLTSTF